MADRTVFGWRRVARILASERDAELLQAMGIPKPTGATRIWARKLLDDTEDFWEVYDVEPDGGAAARAIEAELHALAGDASMSGLTEACEVFSRPLDDSENLDHWVMLLDVLTGSNGWLDGPVVAPPVGLPDRVRAALPDAGWPRTDRIRTRPPESIKDDWEFGFWRETQVDAELLADEVLEARFAERVLGHLARVLDPDDQAALVAWANTEDEARQGEPRPAIWPPKVPLALPAPR
jgi:hypothetical protein